MKCPICGSVKLADGRMDDIFVYGSGKDAVTLTVNVQFYKCKECDFGFTDETAEKARHEAVCRHLNLLTPDDIRKLRESYGFTRGVFADITGLGEASIARWESGLLIQNKSINCYLYLLQFKENISHIIDLDRTNAIKKSVESESPENVFQNNRKYKALTLDQVDNHQEMSKYFSLRSK